VLAELLEACMPIARLTLAARAVLLSVIVTFAAPPLLQLLPGSHQATVEATVASDKDEERNKEKEKEKKEKAENQDRVMNGQVLEINSLKDPPELIVGSVDGQTVIRVLKTDEIVRNGVHLGDYIQANGEKISELLFEATELSVSARYGADISDNDNSDE
jgi:ribosomal protein L9